MRIEGEWLLCTDGITRPFIRVQVPDVNGSLVSATFLVDTGADRTVFTAAFLQTLQIPVTPVQGPGLAGVGGHSGTVEFGTTLEFTRSDGASIRVHGLFAGFTAPNALDMNVLGREVLDIFDVIVSRPRNEVLLLSGSHRYQVV
jgi:hypothetical protein